MQEIERTEWSMMQGESFFSGFLGQALMLYELAASSSSCDAITPMCSIPESAKPSNFNGEFITDKSEYYESSIMACYLENISTPWRTADYTKKMRASDITRMLTSSRRRMYLDTKICFRDDQVLSNFASLSGQDLQKIMNEDSYASLPVARGTDAQGYYSNIEKQCFDPRTNHFFPRFLKAKNKSSRHKPDRYSEVVYTDWCCSSSIGKKVRHTFTRAKSIPKGVLAALNIKYDLEFDEISEAFVGFDDVLDDYDAESDNDDDSDDDDY